MRFKAAIVLIVLAGSAVANPRSDYLLHCGGCHLPDATGLPPTVPSLVGTLGGIAASPEGRDYLARVPGASQAPLTDADLAAVLNWILNEYNSDSLPASFKPLSAGEVRHSRARALVDPLKTRNELWPDSADY
jgi:mono/diheme cytochrome c family protein